MFIERLVLRLQNLALNKVSPQTPLLQTKQPQFPQSLLMRLVF